VGNRPSLTSIRIQGYRPFRDFTANFGPLEVLVGANGSGKTALAEFLRFLRDGMEQAIPPEIVAGEWTAHRSYAGAGGDRVVRDVRASRDGGCRSLRGETGSHEDLSLADLSDGMLRLMCWAALCFLPHPPSLIFIDEPDQGVHPRTLPVLAGLFEKASERTQIVLATHNSWFLSQFDLGQLGVLRRVGGEAAFLKPSDSAVLRSILEEFGTQEIEAIHRSEELEVMS